MWILKSIGWFALFILVGLTGMIGILIAGAAIIGAQHPVRPPVGTFVYTDAWERGYAYATGTWVMENSRQAFPISRHQ